MRSPAGRGRGKWVGVLCALGVGIAGGCGPGTVEKKPGSESGEAFTPPPLAPPAPPAEPVEPTGSGDASTPPPPPLNPLSGLRVTRDEVIRRGLFLTNDLPSLSLRSDGEPEVTYPIAEGGYEAYFARREPEGSPTWSIEKLPMQAAAAVLQRRADGTPILLVNDGAYGVSLWAREASDWRRTEVLEMESLSKTGGFLIDAHDGLHVAPRPDFQLDYWRKEKVWEKPISYTAGGTQIYAPRLSLSPAGQAHLAFTGGDAIWWAAPPSSAERVTQEENAPTMGHTLMLVTEGGTDGRGRPHLLTKWGFPLKYSTREADGWRTRIVANALDNSYCDYIDQGGNVVLMICTEDFIRITPLALVERGGQVVILYAQHRRKGTSTSNCRELPAFECGAPVEQWEEDEHLLALATPTADGFDVHSLPLVTEPSGGSSQSDARGRIHLVVYDAAPDQGVRYLMLE